jgi:hypothetical protein
MTAPVRTLWGIFLLVVLFFVWYSVAADYGYGAVTGSYSFGSNGEESTLVLRKDQSFQQEVKHDGRVERSQGTWRRIGEGGVVFSKEFLKLPGQVTRTNGEADGEVRKRFGLFLSIGFNPDPGGPVFHKRMFR